MALYKIINPAFNGKSTQFYPHRSIREIRHICHKTLQNLFDIDSIDRNLLFQRLARSLSVEGIIPISTTTTIYNRTNSLFVQQSQLEKSSQFIEDDFNFAAVQDEADIDLVIEKENKRYYSTKKPYPCPSQDYVLSSPPDGYKPIGVQLLARHGSRALTSHDYDVQILKIWQLAKQRNMLTSLGEQLKKDTEVFMDANNHVGRGELTQVGKEEQFGIGTRLFHRLPSLFIPSSAVSVMTSGKKRAVDSAEEFLNGFTKSESNIQISKENSNKKLLYFHKSCSNYMTFKTTDPHVKTKLNSIKNMEQTRTFAREVLTRIYKKEFVELIINGNYENQSDENTDPVTNEVDFVSWLYSMFSVAPGQSQPHLASMLAKYFNQEESNWFAYVHDAQEFYLKGPSIEGITVTYDMAKPLLVDFFSSISACAEGNTNIVARLRFSHAETVIPFATLLRIPGFSDKSVNSLDLYTYENNEWRGDKVAPMAANIQWEIYRHEHNHNQILVRMLYNEMEVRFKQDCKSLTPDSFFYDFNELKRSYANLLLPSNSDVN